MIPNTKYQILNNHVSVLEIDLNALEHNINYFKNKLKPETKVLAVVKAFSYGHDATEISKFLNNNSTIDYLAVAYCHEGITLRNHGVTLPILVLHPQVPNFETIIDYNLEPNLYSEYTLKNFIKTASEKKAKDYPVHLKFNTGLNRLGFEAYKIPEILEEIKNSSIKIQSLFSHLAASEDLNEIEFTKHQIEKFQKISNQILEKLDYKPMLHMSNTSGIINFPEAHFDMVRLGIGMYGFGNDEKETSHLKNVSSLKSIISQIHTLKTGESLGYNRAFIATKTTKTATIPIGHADGISRKLGNGVGFITIDNTECAILGNVCMDMIMVNVTNVNCSEGDTVVIFDNQQTVNKIAKKAETISYEIITGISQRIARRILHIES